MRLMKKRLLIHRAEVDGAKGVEDRIYETVSLNDAGEVCDRRAMNPEVMSI